MNPLSREEKQQIRTLANRQYAISRGKKDPAQAEFYRGRAVGMGKVAQMFNPVRRDNMRRSEIMKATWRRRKRAGGKATCTFCHRPIYAGGVSWSGMPFHKTCLEEMRYGLTPTQAGVANPKDNVYFVNHRHRRDGIRFYGGRTMNPHVGKLKPPNTKFIVSNVEKVLRTGNISHLSKASYEFITSHMGFIAHFSLGGFKDVYSDTHRLAYRLLTSEYSNDMDYSKRWAEQYASREDLVLSYGLEYVKAVSDTIRGVVGVAQRYVSRPMFNPLRSVKTSRGNPLSITASNFLEYPWHDWDEAVKHHAETYAEPKWGLTKRKVLENLLHELGKDEEEVDEDTFVEIRDAIAGYLKLKTVPKRKPYYWNPVGGKASNPRPPAGWWAAMWPKIAAQYPKKKSETTDHYKKAINQIVAGIWWKYPQETKDRLIRYYDRTATRARTLPNPDTVLAKELALYAANTGSIYAQRIVPFIKNYARKKAKGTYDQHRAIEGLANNLAKDVQTLYWKEFGSGRPPVMDAATKFDFGRYMLGEMEDQIDWLAADIKNRMKHYNPVTDPFMRAGGYWVNI